MKTVRKKEREERPKISIIQLLRQQFQIQSKIPERHQDCVVKLERIDNDNHQISATSERNQLNGPIIHIRRRSEFEDTGDHDSLRRTIKVEKVDSPEHSRSDIPSTNSARREVVFKKEIKAEIGDVDEVSNTVNPIRKTFQDSIEPIIIIDDSDDMNENSSIDADANMSIHREDVEPRKEVVKYKSPRKKATNKSKSNKVKLKKISQKATNNVDSTGSTSKRKQANAKNKMIRKCSLCTYETTYQAHLEYHICAMHTKKWPYKCENCNMGLLYKNDLKRHAAECSPDLPFSCSNCNRRFDVERSLKYHISVCLGGKISYECYLCHLKTPHKAIFMRHMKFEHFQAQLRCKYCSGKYKNEQGYQLHINFNCKMLKFSCPLCFLKFERKKEADSHKMSCKKPRFECYICKYTTYNMTAAKITDHITRRHIRKKEFKCPQCSKEFAIKTNLDIHMASHSGKNAFKCRVCRKIFFESYEFEVEHKKNCKKAKRFECYLCKTQNVFSALCNLKRHFESHLRPRPKFVCEICQKTFLVERNRHYHMVSMHGDPKKRKCKHCGKQFSHFKTLITHENMCVQQKASKGKTPFKCSHCLKEFLLPNSLKIHESKCAKSKRYQCHLCGKYTIRGLLKDHMFMHTGEKSVQCPYCPRRFSNKMNFIHHKKRWHPEHAAPRQYNCSQCDNRFTTKLRLDYHLQNNCKIFECHLCGHGRGLKQFKQKHLMLHMKVKHTEKRREAFQCPDCTKSFHFKKSLEFHAQRHSKKLPFGCSDCNLRYADIEKLDAHKCKSKQFECYLCKIPLRNNTICALKTHMQCHYMTFRCDKCSKVFHRKQNLQSHINYVHEKRNERLLKCENCGQKWRSMKKASIHKEKCMKQV